MIKSLIKKYILPKEVDFIAGLQEHSRIIEQIVNELHLCFIDKNEDSCNTIIDDEYKAQLIREKNMNELLDTFITPIDRESIYRVIFQLDWIAISVRHFVLEAKAYKINNFDKSYAEIIKHIKEQSHRLNLGFSNLQKSPASIVVKNAQDVRDTYDKLTEVYIKKMAELSQINNIQDMFIERELLGQLKEISKRLQICANSLEDIVIKMN